MVNEYEFKNGIKNRVKVVNFWITIINHWKLSFRSSVQFRFSGNKRGVDGIEFVFAHVTTIVELTKFAV